MIAKLLPLIPTHHTYVEPYAGAASLFFAKRPASVEVLNDMHSDIVNLYRCLRDEASALEMKRLLELTPYSREEFCALRDGYKTEPMGVKRAWMWMVLTEQCFGGNLREASPAWGYSVTASSRGMAECVSKFHSRIELIPQFHARLLNAQIDHDDALTVITRYDTPDTFFYIDPPYVASKRSSGQYKHEVDDDHHRALVALLLTIQGKALVSCYYSELYQPLTDAGWHKKSWDTCAHAAGRTKGSGIQGVGSAMARVPRTETVIANYPLESNQSLFGGNSEGNTTNDADTPQDITRMDTGKLFGRGLKG